jgi:hypothetical protein
VEKKASFTGTSGMPHMHQSSVPTPDPYLKELITSLSVTDRPDLMVFRKFSEAGKNMPKMRKKQKGSSKQDAEEGSTIVSIVMLRLLLLTLGLIINMTYNTSARMKLVLLRFVYYSGKC